MLDSIKILNQYLIILSLISSTTSILSDCISKPHQIINLPNFENDANELCMYSNRIEIDEINKSNIFYWLIYSEKEQNDTPLVFWLNGGPGQSSLFGLFFEIGPLRFSGSEVKHIKNTWSSKAHLVFVDQPVGTGFSTTQNNESIPQSTEEISSDFYKFLKKFFEENKDLAQNKVYIAGESYAGKYIPGIAKYILEMNEKTENSQKINLKKIYIGNGLFDPKIQREARKDLTFGLNILSENEDSVQLNYLSRSCEYQIANKIQTAWQSCNDITEYIRGVSGDINYYDIRKVNEEIENEVKVLNHYLNRKDVVEKLRVKPEDSDYTNNYWNHMNETVKGRLRNHSIFHESKSELEFLINNYNFPIFLLAGEFDLMEGPQGIERVLYSMDFHKSNEFKNSPRLLWKIKNETGSINTIGYVKQSNGLVFLTLKNSGNFLTKNQLPTVMSILEHNFFSNENKFHCPDDKCDLTLQKCKIFNGCNKNGFCDETTNGVCKCKDKYFGPDCKNKIEPLEIDGNHLILSGDTHVFDLKNVTTNWILNIIFNKEEFKKEKYELTMSLINKKQSHLLYNKETHYIKQSLFEQVNHFFISKEHAKSYYLIIHNEKFVNTNFRLEVREFDFKDYGFWKFGGMGFAFVIFLLIASIFMIYFSIKFYRTYKQSKSMSLIEESNL